MHTIEAAFVAASAFAVFMSSTVIITVLIFPKMRERIFMKIIANMVVCDIIGSAASVLGFPKGHDGICAGQSFVVTFFFKAGWLWTVALAYQLYCVVIYSKFGFSMIHMHAVVWFCTALTTVLPLTTNEYGRDDDNQMGWCFLTGNNKTAASVWGLLTFNLVLLVVVLLISYFLFRIYWRYRTMNIKTTYPEVYTIIDLLILYPPGFLLTWGPNLIMSILLNFGAVPVDRTNSLIFQSVTILATQSGTLVAIIFFMKSKEARYRWYRLFKQLSRGRVKSNEVRDSDQSDHPRDFQDESVYERKIAAEIGPKQSTITFQEPSNRISATVRQSNDRDSYPVMLPGAHSNSLFTVSPRLHSNQTVGEDDLSGFRNNPLLSTDDVEWKSFNFRATSEYGTDL
jgi:hypothetical protein